MDVSSEQPESATPEEVGVDAMKIACEHNERMQTQVMAAREKAAAQEQRQAALQYALLSYGMNGNFPSPPSVRPGGDEIVKRARDFYGFIRGDEPAGDVIPIRVVAAGE